MLVVCPYWVEADAARVGTDGRREGDARTEGRTGFVAATSLHRESVLPAIRVGLQARRNGLSGAMVQGAGEGDISRVRDLRSGAEFWSLQSLHDSAELLPPRTPSSSASLPARRPTVAFSQSCCVEANTIKLPLACTDSVRLLLFKRNASCV